MTVEPFAIWRCKQWLVEANSQTKSVNFVLKSVLLVQLNVKSIRTWSIAKSAQKPVENALRSVAIWAKCNCIISSLQVLREEIFIF